jgi:mono/diheme cytochrome c family protein
MKRIALLFLLAAPAYAAPNAAPEKIGFNKDVRPILADNCFACHGPDPGSRKAGLRLDTEAGFFEDRGEGPTVVRGKPLQSPLYQRIVTKDEDEIMPPKKSHKQLSPAQMEIIRRWIEQGAPWQAHWSFIKPERPALPETKNKKWAKTPIDRFILARLEKAGLTPAPEADKYVLARRVSLDLTGLPPSPEALQAFVADKSPDAYEKLVDKLLASPQYGEHRARYWLDAARYADTHGLHFDNYREMWPYRDWVIKAFNKNQPFDKFTIDQIAGDLLPNPTQDQLVATGFQRCNITTNEGGTIVEENLANYARDRVETTGWVFLGLTANCASCHDHKFDPITAKDFYSMSAFYRNTTQGGLDGNIKDGRGPVMTVITDPDDQLRYDELPRLIKEAKAKVEARKKEATAEFDKWQTTANADAVKLPSEALAVHAPLTEGAGDEIGVTTNAALKIKATGAVEWKADGKLGAAPVIKAGATFDLGNLGDFEKNQSFSYGAWVKPTGVGSGAVFARMDEDSDYRGWDLWAEEKNFAVHVINKWPENALKVSTSDNPMKPNEWQHVFVTYDGSAKFEGVKIFINGTPVKTRAAENRLKDTIRTTVPLRIGQRSKGQYFLNGQVQDVRIYTRKLEPGEVKTLAEGAVLKTLLATPPDKRSAPQKQTLLDYYLTNLDQPFRETTASVSRMEQERESIKAKYPITHIQQEKADSKPMAAVLMRGQYDKLGEKVEAGVFAALNPMPKDAPKNRLGLAQWLVDAENPLTARVTVNRYWQEVFGTGIVKTVEDLGIMGESPTHPELLDWLAVEFRESGWDTKKLFKLMVTSATYRQAAITTPEKRAADRENRLLSRGPRFRMDAEMIRDYALAASGTLSPKMGGPGVKPYNPDGLWEVVGMAGGDTRNYRRDKGENLYRRSVYNFWKRMSPPANLEIFNAPAREVSCVRRERTNTPLQALVVMNDPQFVEAARNLAQAALKAEGKSDDKTLDFIANRLLCRPLKVEERKVLTSGLKEIAAEYEAKPDEAKALIAVGESKPDAEIPAPKLAAWTMISSQMMNLDEVLNK